jgi:hypothetical protein
LIYFAFFEQDPIISSRATRLFKMQDAYPSIRQLIIAAGVSAEKVLVKLKGQLGIRIEPMIQLLSLDQRPFTKNRWLLFCLKLGIPVNQISTLRKIEEAEIDWSLLDSPEAQQVFVELNHLRQLSVQTYSRHTFPPPWDSFLTLEKLNITGRLSSLTDDMERCTALKHLSIAGMRLVQVPAKIFQLPQLTQLFLMKNELASLPDISNPSSQLSHLDLSFNQLTSLSKSFYSLTGLTKLYLHHNKLVRLDAELSNLKKLRILNVGNNNISTLPPLTALTNLEELHCADNKLTELPGDLGSMHWLKVLDIRGNGIAQSVYEKIVAALPTTKVIWAPLNAAS